MAVLKKCCFYTEHVTFPVQLSILLQTCMPGELQSVPSTEPYFSEPAWAPLLWPSAASAEMLLLPPHLHPSHEPISDCSTPQYAPKQMSFKKLLGISYFFPFLGINMSNTVQTWMSRSFREFKACSLSTLSCCFWIHSSCSWITWTYRQLPIYAFNGLYTKSNLYLVSSQLLMDSFLWIQLLLKVAN